MKKLAAMTGSAALLAGGLLAGGQAPVQAHDDGAEHGDWCADCVDTETTLSAPEEDVIDGSTATFSVEVTADEGTPVGEVTVVLVPLRGDSPSFGDDHGRHAERGFHHGVRHARGDDSVVETVAYDGSGPVEVTTDDLDAGRYFVGASFKDSTEAFAPSFDATSLHVEDVEETPAPTS